MNRDDQRRNGGDGAGDGDQQFGSDGFGGYQRGDQSADTQPHPRQPPDDQAVPTPDAKDDE